MREIRFRGKRIDNGELIYGFYYHSTINGLHYIADIKETRAEGVIPETVGQFTGLHDKNGKEIYEGDIAVCTYGKWHEEPKGLTRIGKVMYDVKTCAFKMALKNSAMLVSFRDTKPKDIEVIGNIHDNPELLEAEV